MVMANLWRWLGAAVLACVLMVMTGCETFTTREPLGQRIDMKKKESAGAVGFETLMGRVWVSSEEKSRGAPYKFEKQDETGFTAKELDSKGGGFQGFARVWDDRLILHVGCVNQTLQRPMLMCVMLKISRASNGEVTALVFAPKVSAFRETRVTAAGEKVKLEFYTAKNESDLWIKSDEETLKKYFSTCTPNDLFELVKDRWWIGVSEEEYRAKRAAP